MSEQISSENNSPILPDRKPRKNYWALTIIIGLILTTVGVYTSRTKKTLPVNTTEVNSALQTNTGKAQAVIIGKVEQTKIEKTLEATGDVAAFELIPVTSAATGLQIKQVLVDEGEFVKNGQLLALLDDAVLQAQLIQAKAAKNQVLARLAELKAGNRKEDIAQAKQRVIIAEQAVIQAESDLELVEKRVARNRTLQAEGAIAQDRLDEILNQKKISQANLQQARSRLQEAQQELAELEAGPRLEIIARTQAELAQAEGQIKLVQAQLQQTRILAPVSGKISRKNALVGDLTSSTKNLFEIIQNGRLELKLRIPETQLNQIRLGQRVKISSDINNQIKLAGIVREIQPVVERESRQGVVNVDIPALANLKPGMFLRGKIIVSNSLGLTVPTKAVLPQTDGKAIVYVVQPDNTVVAKKVVMGEILANGQIEISNGLDRGEKVVVQGAAYLKDGDLVKIINTAAIF
ncbi:MAG: efflux RND transporter periplasmic adaptor subunit [Cyanobacteria bacterium J083]|nr:MAG: efflux RND transporter periplasmic adaptor subunit [Cyanobacteria bacterium J083]